jgi:hypothetical protein
MKATIEIPDELYRRVKAKSALEGRSIRAVAIELFKKWSGEVSENTASRPPSAYDVMKAYCGVVASGVPDLAADPRHLEGFGEDRIGEPTDHR